MIAPEYPFLHSHRHFSHAMAIYPLIQINWSQGEEAQELITKTVNNLTSLGTDWWTGYSFSWLGNIQAQMKDGDAAAKTLRIFAENFCLPNSFHVNGEQHNRGFSKFKYRPFTLEGNFAFASAIQEMLIQSNTGTVEIFPAIPESWKDASFRNLRTEGAFTVSAEKQKGKVIIVDIRSEKGGVISIKNPFENNDFITHTKGIKSDDIIVINMKEGQNVILKKR